MKKTNILAAATAAVMALASLPVVSASAAETYQPGDVDMDGIITGHDSAVVSRALYEEGASLTPEQLTLADINGDRIVDQTDLEWIHGQEEYMIGDVLLAKLPHVLSLDAYKILCVERVLRVGYQLVLTDTYTPAEIITYPNNSISVKSKGIDISHENKTVTISRVQYNLMDVNGDNHVNYYDAYYTLQANSRYWVGKGNYPVEGRYELLPDCYEKN